MACIHAGVTSEIDCLIPVLLVLFGIRCVAFGVSASVYPSSSQPSNDMARMLLNIPIKAKDFGEKNKVSRLCIVKVNTRSYAKGSLQNSQLKQQNEVLCGHNFSAIPPMFKWKACGRLCWSTCLTWRRSMVQSSTVPIKIRNLRRKTLESIKH